MLLTFLTTFTKLRTGIDWTAFATDVTMNAGFAFVEETAEQPQRFYRLIEN
jgi:hypothetical protein